MLHIILRKNDFSARLSDVARKSQLKNINCIHIG